MAIATAVAHVGLGVLAIHLDRAAEGAEALVGYFERKAAYTAMMVKVGDASALNSVNGGMDLVDATNIATSVPSESGWRIGLETLGLAAAVFGGPLGIAADMMITAAFDGKDVAEACQ